MRLTAVLCSVALVVHGIKALPVSGRNLNSPKHQRRARFRRRQHWGPSQGGRQNGIGNVNNLKPVPPAAIAPHPNDNAGPGSPQGQDLPPLEPSLEGGPVSGLNFLPGDGDDDINTASISVLNMTTTTPCITTVTQTVDVTLLITASRPRPNTPLLPLPGLPPAPATLVGDYPAVDYPPVPPYAHPRPNLHPRPGPGVEALPLPLPLPQAAHPTSESFPDGQDGSPKTINLMVAYAPASTLAPFLEPAAASTPTAPLTSVSVDINNLPLEGVAPSAAAGVSATSTSSNSLWAEFWPGEQVQGTAARAVAETGAAALDESDAKKKRDVDCDDDKIPSNKPDLGSGSGPGHLHDVAREGGMITRTRTRTIQHFATITPSVVDPPRRPHPVHNIPHVPLPPPLLAPPAPEPVVTVPPKSPSFRRPEPYFDVQAESQPEHQIEYYPEAEVQMPAQVQFKTTLCLDDMDVPPSPTTLPGGAPHRHQVPDRHRHIHYSVQNIHPDNGRYMNKGPGDQNGAMIRGNRKGGPPQRRDYDAQDGEHKGDQQLEAEQATDATSAHLIQRVVEEAPRVAISLDGCYQRCLTTQGQPNGCKSYAYYPALLHPHPQSQDVEARGESHRPRPQQEEYSNEAGQDGHGQGKARCDLFREEIAGIFSRQAATAGHAADFASPSSSLLDHAGSDGHSLPPVQNTWFDLECGRPLDERWASLGV